MISPTSVANPTCGLWPSIPESERPRRRLLPAARLERADGFTSLQDRWRWELPGGLVDDDQDPRGRCCVGRFLGRLEH
jgi:hypothetical protein